MKAKYLSLLALSALLVSCGPTTSAPTTSVEEPSSEPTTSVVPTTDPTSDPTIPPFNGPKSVGLIGAFEGCNWDNEVEFTKADEEGRVWTLDNFAFHKGDEWKIRANDGWDWQWAYDALDEASAALFENAGGYGNIKVLTSAYYSISVNAVDDIVTVTKGEEIADNPFVAPESIGIIGSFADNNWVSNAYELESADGGHTWTVDDVELLAETQFKLRLNNDWAKAWGYDNFDDATKELFTRADDGNAIVTTSGYYSFVFNYDEEVVSISLDQEIIEIPSFEEAVAASFEAHESVKAGTISYSEEDIQYGYDSATEYAYEFGEDKNGTFVYSQEVTEYNTIEDYYMQSSYGTWYSVYLDGDSFSTNTVDGNEKFEYGTTLDILGYRFAVNGAQGLLEFVADALAEDANGTAEFLSDVGLYQVSTSISYITDYPTANRVWDVTASVTFGELGNLESIVVLFEEYNNVVEDLETGAWVKGPESTNTTKTTISCEQEVGERTIENPIDIDACFYTAWDLGQADYDENWELVVGDAINLEEPIVLNNGVNFKLAFTNVEPATANSSIDTATIKMIEGNEDDLGIRFNEYSGMVTLNPTVEGDYVVEISTTNVTKTVKFKILPAAAESITAYTYSPNGDMSDVDIVNDGDSIDYYVGVEYHVGGNISPRAADQEKSYEILEGADIVDTKVEEWAQSAYADPSKMLSVTAKSEGTIKVKVSATLTPEVFTVISINFHTAPDVSTYMSKTWVAGNGGEIRTQVQFTASAEDWKVGSVNIGLYDWGKGLTFADYSYSYDETTRVFALKDSEGNDVEVELYVNGKYALVCESSSLIELTNDFYFLGSYFQKKVDSLCDGEIITNSQLMFEIDNHDPHKGSFTFYTMDANWNRIVGVDLELEYEIVETEGGYSLSFTAESLEAIAATEEISNLTISFDKTVSTATISFTSATYGDISLSITKGY